MTFSKGWGNGDWRKQMEANLRQQYPEAYMQGLLGSQPQGYVPPVTANNAALMDAVTNISTFDTAWKNALTKPKEKPVETKHHKLKSIVLAIVVLYLVHKLWSNREKLMARAEKLIHKTGTKLGLID